ncbi:unnamed protein product [Polarella glacialis]|uniref:Uncharacterized protein n=1 Tax=Polarella glacialis TaxID=89957 RepID=A0A813LXL9_POLGL|nr:unnamed protein product [Polarella glacialis]
MELRALLLSVTVAPLVLTQDATRFARVPGVRCAERAGDYPLGDVGAEWNQELESEAKLRCFGDPECLGVMHYVGSNPHHCKEWCGRPQFCTLDGPINPNSDWISFIKADMMQELQRAPAEDHNAQDSVDAEEVARGWREVTCPATEWSSAATDRPKVVLLSRSLTDLPVPGACHVLREEPGILLEPGDQAIPDGILSQTEREGLRFFAAESGPGDVSGDALRAASGCWS